jgi:uncharacterized membrane protein YccC
MAVASFPQRGVFALRFAVNIFLGTTIVWFMLRDIVPNPIWAVASMVAAIDPKVEVAARMFKSRMINVLVGCAVGLTFIAIGGSSEWKLPLALAVTVLVSSYLVRVPTMWRQAPITAALIIAATLTHHSTASGLEHGLGKVAEVLFGCVAGLLVSWAMARVWPMEEPAQGDADS